MFRDVADLRDIERWLRRATPVGRSSRVMAVLWLRVAYHKHARLLSHKDASGRARRPAAKWWRVGFSWAPRATCCAQVGRITRSVPAIVIGVISHGAEYFC